MGRGCDSVSNGLRRFEHGKHVVFYRIVTEGILIVRVLHQRMLPMKPRFESGSAAEFSRSHKYNQMSTLRTGMRGKCTDLASCEGIGAGLGLVVGLGSIEFCDRDQWREKVIFCN
jgi:hypothetical protein